MHTIGRYQNRASLKERRKFLRHHQTEAERRLWQKIRSGQLGVKFRRQYNIDYYIVDFYCHELKLVIEIDGWIHSDETVMAKDQRRDEYLKQKGYTIIRYRNEQIKFEMGNVIQDIMNRIKTLRPFGRPPPPPPHRGRD